MSEIIQTEPDRLYIDRDDRTIYTNILKNEEFFKNKGNIDIFLFAMLIGYKNNISISSKIENPDGWVRTEYIKKPEDWALIDSIALSISGSADILANRPAVFKISEELAHGGIKLLENMIKSTQYGTFWKQYEKELFEMYSDLNIE